MEIRPLDPRDIDRSFLIRTRSFGPLSGPARVGAEAYARTAIDEGRMLGGYDGDLLVARATIRPYSQYWGGRPVAMAGVAGVVVSPEYRNRGVGSALMRGVIERTRELDFPLSVLYPATVPVYRQQGWEMAGVQPRYSVPSRFLRGLCGDGVAVREARPADAAEFAELVRSSYTSGRACGPLGADEAEFAEGLGDSAVFAYLADDGFVMYGWEGHDLVVHQLVAASASTTRALWAVVGSGSSVAETVHAYLAPDDPLHHLLADNVKGQVRQTWWMLRLLDARAAIVGRGFAAGVEIDVPLVIEDPQVAGNCIAGRLQVGAGAGDLVADSAVGPSDPVRLSANGVAALYAGLPTASLVTAGLLRGGTPEQRGQLDLAFAGRGAYLLDYF